MGSKPSKAIAKSIQHDKDGVLLTRLVITHYCRSLRCILPEELINLCLKMIGFVMCTNVLLETEKLHLYRYLKLLKQYESDNAIIYCTLMSCTNPTRSSFVNLDDLISKLRHRTNLLFVIKTEFNHVFIVFIPETIDNVRVSMDVSVYLLRSQFKYKQCPKQYTSECTVVYCDSDSKTGKRVYLGGITLYDNAQCFINAKRMKNCQGNELFGGLKFISSSVSYARINQLEIYQLH
eukprot:214037_1